MPEEGCDQYDEADSEYPLEYTRLVPFCFVEHSTTLREWKDIAVIDPAAKATLFRMLPEPLHL